MSQQKILLLDVDGVFADFLGGVLHHLTLHYKTGEEVTRESITEWAFIEKLSDRSRDRLDKLLSQYTFWRSLKTIPRSSHYFPTLAQYFDTYFVTAPWPGCQTWTHARSEWLKHRLGVSPDRIIFTSRKELIRGDILIDDNPAFIRKWKTANPRGKAYLFDTPYAGNPKDCRAVQKFSWDDNSYNSVMNLY